MKSHRSFLLTLIVGALTVLSQTPAMASERTVVLELFTSQGCSSCPPADALLTELSKKSDIIALSFHVDYWDYIGWKDEHALPISSERQRAYAQRMNLRYVYTPQVVVDGREQTVGSKLSEIHHCIEQTAHNPRLALERTAANQVTVTAPSDFPGLAAPLDVVLVSYVPWTVAQIGRGENRGRTLGYSNSVRAVEKLGALDSRQATFTLPEIETDGAVLLVQDAGHGAIHGALRVGEP